MDAHDVRMMAAGVKRKLEQSIQNGIHTIDITSVITDALLVELPRIGIKIQEEPKGFTPCEVFRREEDSKKWEDSGLRMGFLKKEGDGRRGE